LEQDFLSEVELYFCPDIKGNEIVVDGEEAHHISKVMRHKPDDILFITDGMGCIYECAISAIEKRSVRFFIRKKIVYENKFKDCTICIPRLKIQDRLEFAIEKSVELGFTKIIIFESERSNGKKDKSDRWEKIALSAMKQSLRSFLPEISFTKNIFLEKYDGETLLFDQNGTLRLQDYLQVPENKFNNMRFIVGPEGGFSEKELLLAHKYQKLKLTGNRLRSETAVITAASIISQYLG